MSFRLNKSIIEEGDTVILYFGFENLYQIRIEKDKVHQFKYGALKHNDLIGKQFGEKVHCPKGWLYALYPTPELWTVSLPHRTQILYSRDISEVTFQLDLRPGSVIVESGTGSASLSHALVRTVAPTGHLYTFEFHEQRCETAKREFEEHGIGDLVTCTHRDVCANGFALENVADAVFLDLPSPWDVIPYAKQALKKTGGRVCSFSPCIEQVQRTCETLEQLGFCEITTMECLLRKFDVRTVNMPLPDLGWGPGKVPDFKDVGASFHAPVIGKLEGVETGENNGDAAGEQDSDNEANHDKSEKDTGDASKGPPTKKQKKGSRGGKRRQTKEKGPSEGPSFVFKTALPPIQMPGHTGYLTFASLYAK